MRGWNFPFTYIMCHVDKIELYFASRRYKISTALSFLHPITLETKFISLLNTEEEIRSRRDKSCNSWDQWLFCHLFDWLKTSIHKKRVLIIEHGNKWRFFKQKDIYLLADLIMSTTDFRNLIIRNRTTYYMQMLLGSIFSRAITLVTFFSSAVVLLSSCNNLDNLPFKSFDPLNR